MKDIHFLINGQDYGEPRGWEDILITADWQSEKKDQSINVDNLAFVKKAKRYIEQRLSSAASGGKSIFEGEPLQIIFGQLDDPDFVFDGYLDFAEETNYLSHDEVEEIQVSIKQRKGSDWLNDVADSFTFRYLFDQGIITQNDFVRVPYIINYIPDGLALVTLSISTYLMTKELVENIQKLAETIADVTDASTPVVGVSVGVGTGVVTAWDLGNFILVTIKAIARIAYIIALTVAIIKLINEIFEQLFPAKRYHIGMKMSTMAEKACEYLGLQFQSDLLNSQDVKDWVIIPSKDRKGVKSGFGGQNGLPTNRDSIDTFGDWIRVHKEMFNADFRIQDGVFRFERKDFWEQNSTFILPKYFGLQERLLTRGRPNTSEFISNYNITYEFDRQDQNTLDDVTGQVFQAITKPSFVENEDLLNVKNLAQISIPYSIGKRKNGLTTLEEVGKALGSLVDTLTGVFGGGTNFASQIESRIGSMLLSSHFLTVPRIVQIAGNNISKNQRVLLGADRLWNDYHSINSFVPINGNHNQWMIFEEIEIPLNGDQFRSLLNNNFVTDEEGNNIRFDFSEWDRERGVAKVDFRIKQIYDKNLQITIV